MGFAKKVLDHSLQGFQGDTIVVYDKAERQTCGYRVAWLLRALKLVAPEVQIKVLDGGFPKWVKENLPVSECKTTDLHKIPRDDDTIPDHNDFQPGLIKFLDDMHKFEASIDEGKPLFVLIDARKSSDVEQGTIVGQVNYQFTDCFNVDGDVKTMKSLDERKKMFKDLSPANAQSKELVIMCRSGVTATIVIGALADLY